MSHRPLPIWVPAGLGRTEYRDLPWPKKRVLIVRYQGLPVFEISSAVLWRCPRCGYAIASSHRAGYVKNGRCPKDSIPYAEFIPFRCNEQPATMGCTFVPDCLPHNFVLGAGTAKLSWYPHEN